MRAHTASMATRMVLVAVALVLSVGCAMHRQAAEPTGGPGADEAPAWTLRPTELYGTTSLRTGMGRAGVERLAAVVDGDTLVAADHSGGAVVWDGDGAERALILTGAGPARHLAFVGGRRLVTVLDDGAVVCRTLDDGGVAWSATVGEDEPPALRAQGSRVVVTRADGLVVLDAADGERLAEWRAPADAPPVLLAAPAGDDVLVVHADGRVGRWSRATGYQAVHAPADGEDVGPVAASGSVVATVHGRRTLRVRTAETQVDRVLPATVRALAVAGDRVLAGTGRRLHVFAADAQAPVLQAELPPGHRIRSIAAAASGDGVWVGDDLGTVWRLDAEDGRAVFRTSNGPAAPVVGVMPVPGTDDRVAMLAADGTCTAWRRGGSGPTWSAKPAHDALLRARPCGASGLVNVQWGGGEPDSILAVHPTTATTAAPRMPGGAMAVASPGGRAVAVADGDTVRVETLDPDRLIAEWPVSGLPNALAVSDDGLELVVQEGHFSGETAILSAAPRRRTLSLQHHMGVVRNLAISPAGRLLVIEGLPSAEVWDIGPRRRRHVLREEGGLGAIAVSRDARLAAALTSRGDALILYDLLTGAEICRRDLSPRRTRASRARSVHIDAAAGTVWTGHDAGVARAWTLHARGRSADTGVLLEAVETGPAARAVPATHILAERGDEVVEAVRARLALRPRTVPVEDRHLRTVLTEDDARHALDALETLEESAAQAPLPTTALLEAVDRGVSDTVEAGILDLLAAYDGWRPSPGDDHPAAGARRIALLEQVGTDDARELLRAMRTSTTDEFLWFECRTALARMRAGPR